MEPHKIANLLEEMAALKPLPTTIGPWRIHSGLIEHRENHYSAPFDVMTTSAAVLDWIIQIAEKRWATDEALGQFVRLLNAHLQPQATLCSDGKERGPIDPLDVMDGLKRSRDFMISQAKEVMAKAPV